MKKKTILITGGGGFVGRRLVEILFKKNYRIYSLERKKDSQNNPYTKDTIIGDITDWQFIDKLFKKLRVEICFHLASHALVDIGTHSPRETLKNNIEGAWNILEASRIHATERVIIASTAHVYGNNTQVPYKEYYTPRPSRIYETSKTCADIIAQSYIVTYEAPIFIGRFTNIYGPGDLNYSRIIPKTIQSIVKNENPVIWGGSAIRDYLYIDDAISGYVKLATMSIKKRKNHIFNFGSGEIISVKELVEKILYISKKQHIPIRFEKVKRKDEIQIQYVSSEKAKRLLKWRSKISLDKGIKKTIQWYEHIAK
jgi:CDP-glucose 4,6-dehydratase